MFTEGQSISPMVRQRSTAAGLVTFIMVAPTTAPTATITTA